MHAHIVGTLSVDTQSTHTHTHTHTHAHTHTHTHCIAGAYPATAHSTVTPAGTLSIGHTVNISCNSGYHPVFATASGGGSEGGGGRGGGEGGGGLINTKGA